MSSSLNSILRDIHSSIAEICDKHGINYESSELKEIDGQLTLKSKMSRYVDGLTIYQNNYLKNCSTLGLDADWLFQDIVYKSHKYKILGYYPRKTKKPIKIIDKTSRKQNFLHPDEIRFIWKRGKKTKTFPLS